MRDRECEKMPDEVIKANEAKIEAEKKRLREKFGLGQDRDWSEKIGALKAAVKKEIADNRKEAAEAAQRSKAADDEIEEMRAKMKEEQVEQKKAARDAQLKSAIDKHMQQQRARITNKIAPLLARANQLEGFLAMMHTMCTAKARNDPTSMESNSALAAIMSSYMLEPGATRWIEPLDMLQDFAWPTEPLAAQVQDFLTPNSES